MPQFCYSFKPSHVQHGAITQDNFSKLHESLPSQQHVLTQRSLTYLEIIINALSRIFLVAVTVVLLKQSQLLAMIAVTKNCEICSIKRGNFFCDLFQWQPNCETIRGNITQSGKCTQTERCVEHPRHYKHCTNVLLPPILLA